MCALTSFFFYHHRHEPAIDASAASATRCPPCCARGLDLPGAARLLYREHARARHATHGRGRRRHTRALRAVISLAEEAAGAVQWPAAAGSTVAAAVQGRLARAHDSLRCLMELIELVGTRGGAPERRALADEQVELVAREPPCSEFTRRGGLGGVLGRAWSLLALELSKNLAHERRAKSWEWQVGCREQAA